MSYETLSCQNIKYNINQRAKILLINQGTHTKNERWSKRFRILARYVSLDMNELNILYIRFVTNTCVYQKVAVKSNFSGFEMRKVVYFYIINKIM